MSKKLPSEYPQFSFRVSTEEKEALNKRLETLLKKFQDGQSSEEYIIRKNDVILKALSKGIEILERDFKKK